MEAQCQCGQLRVEYPGETPAVVACHCLACQRRTGAPFAVLAYYPADHLTITGEAARFSRTADSGNEFDSFFCPACGSTVYVRASARPEMLGLAVGTMADPGFKAPINSVWEEAKHPWVTIPGDIQHFAQARQ
jgi:hypothetical protein